MLLTMNIAGYTVIILLTMNTEYKTIDNEYSRLSDTKMSTQCTAMQFVGIAASAA